VKSIPSSFHDQWDWIRINMGGFWRWMHQFIRIPVDRTLMANESSALLVGNVGGSSAKQTKESTKTGPAAVLSMILYFLFAVACVLCIISCIYYLSAASMDSLNVKKDKVDRKCGDGLILIVYVHCIVHFVSLILFLCLVTPVMVAVKSGFKFEEDGGVSPFCFFSVLLVFCIGCIIAFSVMAAQMDVRFQDAFGKEECVDAMSRYGNPQTFFIPARPYPLEVLRNMYLVLDSLYCVFFFLLICVACLEGADVWMTR
jgi:hypothetical protein